MWWGGQVVDREFKAVLAVQPLEEGSVLEEELPPEGREPPGERAYLGAQLSGSCGAVALESPIS